MQGLEDSEITYGGGEDCWKLVVWWWNFFWWGIPETAGLWWLARGLRTLTGYDSHSLQMWLIYISHECCAKKNVWYHQCNASLGLFWEWGRLFIGCTLFYLFIFALGIIGGGGICGLLTATKTWKTTGTNVARPILACLREKNSSHIYKENGFPRKSMLW